MPTTSAVLLLLVLMFTAGCMPATPSAKGWETKATQALEDVASEVATARLVLREEQRSRMLAASPEVMLVDAEESAASSADTFDRLQPPTGLSEAQARVSTALADGLDLITDVRIAIVDEDRASYADLRKQLDQTHTSLVELSEKPR